MMNKETLFEEKYYQYHDTIFRIACSYANKKSDVEDIVQDVFIQYFTKAPTFLDDNHEKYWLIRVTINIAKNYNKLAWNRKVSLDEEMITLMKDEETKEEDLRIIQAINQLSNKYKEVIILYYYENYSSEEIAKVLGLTISNVNVRLKRGREKIKQRLEEEVDE